MTLEDRILEAEKNFNTQQSNKNDHMRAAEEAEAEMHRFQGEWRALTSLKEYQDTTAEADKSEDQ